MRIALVAQSQAPWTPHYARAFQAAGQAVTVFSFSPGEIAGVPTVLLGPEGERTTWAKAQFLLRVPRLRRGLQSFSPDVVLTTYVLSDGLATALAWNGPFVVSARGGDVLHQAGNPPIPEWIRGRMIRFVCRRARRVHSVSEEIGEALAAYGVDRAGIVDFPMGVDVDRFQISPEPGADTASRLICTRRHDAVYDNHVIVDAVARLKDRLPRLRATFVGGGPLFEARRAQAERAGLDGRVLFVAQVEHIRLPGLLHEHGLYVSASSSDGTSSSLLEAMGCGLLPIVSRIPANLPWVRDGENGLLFDVGDATSLARAIERGVADASLRAAARTKNPAIVRERGDQRANNRRMLVLLEEAARR